MNFKDEARQLVSGITYGEMSSTAYDTSWFLRLKGQDGQLLFPSVKEWVITHQHEDGSWGAMFETYYDRLISTLAAVNALYQLDSGQYSHMIERGLDYIRKNAKKLKTDEYETIGFELLFPTLLDEAAQYGFALPYEEFLFVRKTKEFKLSKTPENWVYLPETPLTHNLEFLADQLHVQKAAELLEMNGSVGNSPSASAYLAQFVQNDKLQRYLHDIMKDSPDGGVCNVRPFEVFELSWVYYNLLISGLKVDEMVQGVQYLHHSWRTNGIGISKDGLMPDADDSALAMNVLSRFGYDVKTDFLDSYYSEKGYLSFPFEKNPSVSTNIHILDVIRNRKDERSQKMKAHILDFLYSVREENRYWKDKWHISPYYATAHAILALRDTDQGLIDDAVTWILSTQHADGSWGVFDGTLEETSYCVQALILSKAYLNPFVREQLERAVHFLKENINDSYFPELWIGKGLYSPIKVIQAAIVSALALFEKEVNALVKC
jgi:halimadienyl-diphosphate synthase